MTIGHGEARRKWTVAKAQRGMTDRTTPLYVVCSMIAPWFAGMTATINRKQRVVKRTRT